MWCNSDDDHPAHGPCPGLPYAGFGAVLALAPWNDHRPHRDALVIEADGTGPAAAEARRQLRITPEGLHVEVGNTVMPPGYTGPQALEATPDGWLVVGEQELIATLGPDGHVSIVSRHTENADLVRMLRTMADVLEMKHSQWLAAGTRHTEQLVPAGGDLRPETAPDGGRYLVASDGVRYGPFPAARTTPRCPHHAPGTICPDCTDTCVHAPGTSCPDCI